jgi:hypothetical protein
MRATSGVVGDIRECRANFDLRDPGLQCAMMQQGHEDILVEAKKFRRNESDIE